MYVAARELAYVVDCGRVMLFARAYLVGALSDCGCIVGYSLACGARSDCCGLVWSKCLALFGVARGAFVGVYGV